MKMHKLIIGLVVLLLAGSIMAEEKGDHVAIIVNKKSGFDNLPLAQLTKIFRGERSKDAQGNKIVIVMREKDSPERAAVLKNVYGMTEQEYQKYFLQATFTGAVQSAPRQISGAAAIRAFVANNPGAIAYVRGTDVDDTVAIVKVDGKAPGDDGYGVKLK